MAFNYALMQWGLLKTLRPADQGIKAKCTPTHRHTGRGTHRHFYHAVEITVTFN